VLLCNIVLYLFSIIYSTSIESAEILGYAHSIALFNALLCTLQVLHVIWFGIIAKAAYKAVVVGEVRRHYIITFCIYCCCETLFISFNYQMKNS